MPDTDASNSQSAAAALDMPAQKQAGPPPQDPKLGLQLLLLLDVFVRLFIWWSSLALTVALFTRLKAWPDQQFAGPDLGLAWLWGQKLGQLVLIYNLIYIAHLLVLRMLIPTPKEGRYDTVGGKLDRQLLYSGLLSTLTKARMQPPFPGFLVFHLANLPPMSWLMGPIFGPRSRSCYVADPCIIDPHLVSIGRNVVIGLNTTIAAHYQERDSVHFRRTIIEDDVLIGGYCAMAGAHIKKGAVVGAGSMILSGSVIGENEYWSGNPARRRRVLPPPGQRGEDQLPPEQDS